MQFPMRPTLHLDKLPLPPPSKGFAHLTNRALISIYGVDAARFLQGLTTANIQSSPSRPVYFSAFLNAQGRVLYDVFIYPEPPQLSVFPHPAVERDGTPGFLIDADKAQVEDLHSHLKKFKLRAKIKMRVLDPMEADVWSTWTDEDVSSPSYPAPLPPSTKCSPRITKSQWSAMLKFPDPRLPSLGHRIIALKGKPPRFKHLHGAPASCETYEIRRILHGIPQGAREILSGEALPQESNLDYMSGIDFRKGCYVGQELTIRTHHTGVVRKRILPVQLYRADAKYPPHNLEYDMWTKLEMPSQGQNITRVDPKGRSAGKWLGGVGNVGLALCRLETMTDIKLTEEGGGWSPKHEFKMSWRTEGDNGEEREVKVKAFVPEWYRRGESKGILPGLASRMNKQNDFI
ncbi:MAG: hypothetical protein Q9218_004373 [Villophora microphyllina]